MTTVGQMAGQAMQKAKNRQYDVAAYSFITNDFEPARPHWWQFWRDYDREHFEWELRFEGWRQNKR